MLVNIPVPGRYGPAAGGGPVAAPVGPVECETGPLQDETRNSANAAAMSSRARTATCT